MSAKIEAEALRSRIYPNRPITDARRRLLRICYEMPEQEVAQAIAALVPLILIQLKRAKRSTAQPPHRRGAKKGGARY